MSRDRAGGLPAACPEVGTIDCVPSENERLWVGRSEDSAAKSDNSELLDRQVPIVC